MGRNEHVSDRTGRQGRRRPAHGLPCPECGALRAPDNTPSCACARRASDALRQTRTAEAAAAEDFDPLRIRPYVELEGPGGAADGDLTMRLRAVPADETMPLPRTGTALRPGAPDLSPFEFETATGPDDELRPDELRPDEPGPRRGGRRRAVLIAATGAVVAVAAAAGFAGGLFSYEAPTRHGAAAKDVRAAVPDTSTSAASASAGTSRSAAPTAADAPPSASDRRSPSPSASGTSASPSAAASASASASATAAAPTARATGTIGPDNSADDSRQTVASPVLRLGDKGTEVTELQLRLQQLRLYTGEADGTFSTDLENALRNYQWSRAIEDDEPGVYGPATRTHLESETKEP